MLDSINNEVIIDDNDTLNMLDMILEKWDKEWWENFYSDKYRDIPFFTNAPDENLVELINTRHFDCKVSLDIGCGNGRNARYLAANKFKSVAIDISEESIAWAIKLAKDDDVNVEFINGSFFDKEFNSKFDLIHDSGCLHHIKPHRRNKYLEKVHSLLKPDGIFSLTCFNLKGGANISDYEVYKGGSMQGGLGYTFKKIEKIVYPYFNILEIRDMKELDEDIYGKNICLVVKMSKK